jgi:NADPH:quinone reductase-like Zn-dependent oxidoreductase
MVLNMVTQTSAWVLKDQQGIDSLQLVENHPVPTLSENDVLVKLHAASLNARDIVIAKVRSHRNITESSQRHTK